MTQSFKSSPEAALVTALASLLYSLALLGAGLTLVSWILYSAITALFGIETLLGRSMTTWTWIAMGAVVLCVAVAAGAAAVARWLDPSVSDSVDA